MKVGPSSRIKADAAFLKLQGKAPSLNRAQSELAAQVSARDENMLRLRQLRLERDAQALQAAKTSPSASKVQKVLRRPGKAGRG